VAFYRGEGVEQDYETARKLFQKAAEQGVVFAMLNCGVCYEFGQGCQQDYGMALQYYNAAAEQGNAKALWRAGWLEAVFFEHHETGIALMEKAFEKGAVNAAFDLGQVYSAKNPCFSIEKAVYWYETSITAEGNQKAYSQLGRLYEKSVKTDDGKRKAIEWYEKAYQNGDKKLCTTIGFLYRDIEEYDVAYEWLRKGQLAGDMLAVEMMKILDNNRCPHCRAIYSKTYKKGLFGEKCVCSKCGKKIKEEE
jgi:TPR repeat protein